jgi:hypothetical protein
VAAGVADADDAVAVGVAPDDPPQAAITAKAAATTANLIKRTRTSYEDVPTGRVVSDRIRQE